MRTILFVLYLWATIPDVVSKQQGISLWFFSALFMFLGWAAGKEERLAEKKHEEWEEKIEGLLLEIKLN